MDIARLLPGEEPPHGMTDFGYDGLFTAEGAVFCGYHGMRAARKAADRYGGGRPAGGRP